MKFIGFLAGFLERSMEGFNFIYVNKKEFANENKSSIC